MPMITILSGFFWVHLQEGMYNILKKNFLVCTGVIITFEKCYRPVRLKEEIAGILLNPNCRYEANFLPFYTLAEWNSCHADADVLEGIATMLIFDHLEIVLVRYSFSEGLSVCYC